MKKQKATTTEGKKLCRKCGITKEFEFFSKSKNEKFGYCTHCKECMKEYTYRNREKLRKYDKKYRNENKHKYVEYVRKRSKIDIQYRLSRNLRIRFRSILNKNNITKNNSIIYLTGCNCSYLKQYLESMFKPEMTWENYGKMWEIDHIKPCDAFDLTDFDQQKECFHYLNHQPLFKTTKIARSFGYMEEIGNRNKANKY